MDPPGENLRQPSVVGRSAFGGGAGSSGSNSNSSGRRLLERRSSSRVSLLGGGGDGDDDDGGAAAADSSSFVSHRTNTSSTATANNHSNDESSSAAEAANGGSFLAAPPVPAAQRSVPPPAASSPPLAPATLLGGGDGRNASFGAYPVAAFVRDLMRTSVDGSGSGNSNSRGGGALAGGGMGGAHHHHPNFHHQHHHHASPSSNLRTLFYQQQLQARNNNHMANANANNNSSAATTAAAAAASTSARGGTAEETTTPLSVRSVEESESDSAALRSASLARAGGVSSAPQVMERGEPSATATTSNRDSEQQQPPHEDVEYILVDGDLIAVPPPPPNRAEQEFLEDRLRQAAEEANGGASGRYYLPANQELLPKNCQPRRVRRGVRKLTRFFKRGAGGGRQSRNAASGSGGSELLEQQQQQQLQQRGSQSESTAATTATAATSASSTTTNNNAVAPPPPDPFGPISMREQVSLREQDLSVDGASGATTATVRSLSPLSRDVLRAPHSAASPPRAATTAAAASKTGSAQSGPPAAGLPPSAGLSPPANRDIVFDQRKKPPPSSSTTTTSPTKNKKKKGRGQGRGLLGRRKQAPPPPPPPSTEIEQPTTATSFEQQQQQQMWTYAAGHNNRMMMMNNNNDGLRPLDPPSTTDVHSANNMAAANNMMMMRTMAPPPMPQPQQQPMNRLSSGTNSVTASYVGTADQLATAIMADGSGANGAAAYMMPPDMSIAESFVEEDSSNLLQSMKKEDDDYDYDANAPLPLSLVADQADYKVDKADTPDVEAMLRRAVLETTTELVSEHDSDCLPTHALPLPPDYHPSSSKPAAAQQQQGPKASIPLSEVSNYFDLSGSRTTVYNDTLKVVMVSANSIDKTWLARRLRNSNSKRVRKRTTLAVEVHEWRPTSSSSGSSSNNSGASATNGVDGNGSSSTAANNNNNGASATNGVNGNANSNNDNSSPTRCVIWDVQGAAAATTAETRSNFGAHPGTQSLFFSAQSLYILVWDLACHNPKTNRIEFVSSKDFDDDNEDDDSDFDDEDENDEFVREEANRQADRALHADISNRVLSWLDCIAQRGPKSAVLPVALIPESMGESEIKRRCDTFQNLLKVHVHRYNSNMENSSPPKLLTGVKDNLLCVRNDGDCQGLTQLQEMVHAIANDPSHSVFDHVGTPVPPGTARVYDAIQKFKQDHKLILLDHVLGEVGDVNEDGGGLSVDLIVGALKFLASIGEIIYFATDGHGDEVLKRYVILSRKWLISALSCILRNDLKRELTEMRRFMNIQAVYADEQYEENDVTKALISGKLSNCPLLSDRDAQMLWQSMNFMREASDRYSNLVESSTSTPTMFYFLERLLVHSGVFLPLQVMQPNAALEKSGEVFFVPSLLPVAQADPQLWSYMTAEAWTTTLCHSWLFRDGSPSNLMETLTVSILRDLYDFARTFLPEEPGMPLKRQSSSRSYTAPASRESFGEFVEEHNNEALGYVSVHQVVCFRSSMLVKIGTVFADAKTNQLRESFVEVFIAVLDSSSPNAVASDVMRPYMQRVVVSGKGQAGKHGLKLWKGGYKCILDSVRRCLSEMPNVDPQVICPECLATSSPRIASTWGWDSVLAVAKSGNPSVICLRGHRVSSSLITNISPKPSPVPPHPLPSIVSIQELLPSIVLVGLWDPDRRTITNIGSGFIVDKKVGLIVTAGHVLFEMNGRGKSNFAKPYHGNPMGRAVIGVIPDADEDGKHAVFRYFADIAAHDVPNADVCVLRIMSRMETDVDDKAGIAAIDQPERSITTSQMQGQGLRSLKTTTKFQLEEAVRIIGYNQGGEGIFEQGRHISRSVDVASGNICRHFKATIHDDSSATSDSSTSQHSFVPKDEIVVMCSTISGHSGGPCINSEGKVVGILSRSDPTDGERCYLVPASEIKPMVMRARQFCMGPDSDRAAQRLQTM